MLGEKVKTFGLSFLIHVAAALALSLLAAPQMLKSAETIEIEILEPAPTPPVPSVAPVPLPPVPEPVPPEIPKAPRPAQVPKTARIVEVQKPTPFQENAATEDGEREAPEDTEAVPAPTAPIPVLDMESTVGTGTSEYVTSATGGGEVAVRAGRGGGKGGDGIAQGSEGPVANQGAVGIKVSRDWQITAMPEPLNDGDFEPEYPPLAKREGREAMVVLRLYIDAEGRVAETEVLEGPTQGGFRQSARKYAMKLRFRPAQAGVTAVASRIDWTVYFYVRN